MQALVERAYHLQLLSPGQRTNMYKMFSAKGWRTTEPGSDDIAPEDARLAAAIGQELVRRGLSADEVARIAGFAESKRNTLFRAGGLRAV
jgi:Zn-dependent peptidase ImmA (M78 family)